MSPRVSNSQLLSRLTLHFFISFLALSGSLISARTVAVSDSASHPLRGACNKTSHWTSLSSCTRLRGSNRLLSPFASASASRLPALGVHSTSTFIPIFSVQVASSMGTALAGNFVVMSLFSADPLPLLSVQVGATMIFERCWEAVPPKKSRREMRTARASSVEMISAGRPPFSYTHGHSSTVTSILNHGDLHGSGAPFSSRTGNHPPRPVLLSLACASTLGDTADDLCSVAQE